MSFASPEGGVVSELSRWSNDVDYWEATPCNVLSAATVLQLLLTGFCFKFIAFTGCERSSTVVRILLENYLGTGVQFDSFCEWDSGLEFHNER